MWGSQYEEISSMSHNISYPHLACRATPSGPAYEKKGQTNKAIKIKIRTISRKPKISKKSDIGMGLGI